MVAQCTKWFQNASSKSMNKNTWRWALICHEKKWILTRLWNIVASNITKRLSFNSIKTCTQIDQTEQDLNIEIGCKSQ